MLPEKLRVQFLATLFISQKKEKEEKAFCKKHYKNKNKTEVSSGRIINYQDFVASFVALVYLFFFPPHF